MDDDDNFSFFGFCTVWVLFGGIVVWGWIQRVLFGR